MQSKIFDKKYIHYSLAYHTREKELTDIALRAILGFDHLNTRKEASLKPDTVQNFIKFNSVNKEQQKKLLEDESYIEAHLDLIVSLNRQTHLMEYVLTTVDGILSEERAVLRNVVEAILAGKYTNLISKLKGLQTLCKKEEPAPLVILAAYRVISLLLGQLPSQQYLQEQKIFILQLLQKKRSQRQLISDYGFVSCLVHLNKHGLLAQVFLDNDGVTLLLECLSRAGQDTQLIYYTLLNLWMLTFLENGVQKYFANSKIGVIKAVCEVLQKVARQKITRVAFMIFKNIQQNHSCLELMIDNRLLKIIDNLLKGSIKDQQLINSIKEIGTLLQSNIRVLSSYEKYLKEIKSQSMEWSSVHTQRFWKQNAMKFDNNDFELIKQLKFLLSSKRTLNVEIACYDLGQFARFYPRGKSVLESLNIKETLLEKARYSEEKSIRQQALKALQKIMIQNWQAI